MTNILKLIEEKINPKYLIYLSKDSYNLYKNINKESTSISPKFLDNKIFEVLDISINNKETYYLIGVDNNELGWVTTENPILIMNSFSECVALKDTKSIDVNNELNETLGIESKLIQGHLYSAKYICNYNGTIYSGLENDDEFFGFYPSNILDFGNIKEISFDFKNNMTKVYKSENLIKSQMIVTENQKYVTTKFYSSLELGEIKLGKNYFWFKQDDTNLTLDQIELISKDFDEYYLEHLIQSIKIEKGLSGQGGFSTGKINKDYVENLNQRINQLKDKNEEYLVLNRKLNKDIKEERLERRRRESKLDYFDRLTTNQTNKINYYEERNKKLLDRVTLLEGKLNNVNTQLKELKNNKLVKIQSKLFGK